MSPRILVVDDDEPSCRLLQAILAPEGHEVLIAHDGRGALELADARRPDAVILDLQLPGMDGFEVIDALAAAHGGVPVIMLTAHGEVRSAVRATQLGAFDYLTKPIDHDEILLVVGRALETRALKSEVERLRSQVGDGGSLALLMGPSMAVRRIVEQVRTVAATRLSVLLLGETGTGKELVAQAIHRQSDRQGKPFIALDCGAIPEQLLESELFGHEKGAFTGADRRKEGRFHLAEGGTLFLDEIGNLPMGLQAKLLRALESRQVQPVGATRSVPTDIRFIAATNHDLQRKVTEGAFRPDLYFRLAQYTITLPPLRERPGDIGYLAQRFMEEASVELRRPVHQLAPDAIAALARHEWPGNVRELRNVIRQAVLESKEGILRGPLVRRSLGKAAAGAGGAAAPAGRSLKQMTDEAVRDTERRAITEALRATRGNKSQAAKALQTDYKTLHVKMKRLGLRGRDFTP
jgi:DNA-binding NtrC family response regulator